MKIITFSRKETQSRSILSMPLPFDSHRIATIFGSLMRHKKTTDALKTLKIKNGIEQAFYSNFTANIKEDDIYSMGFVCIFGEYHLSIDLIDDNVIITIGKVNQNPIISVHVDGKNTTKIVINEDLVDEYRNQMMNQVQQVLAFNIPKRVFDGNIAN